MKLHKSNFSCLILIFIFVFIRTSAQTELKRNNLFDFNWRFHKGGALGAEEPSFDDSRWRAVDLPHDWSIEDLPGTNSPFNIDAISQVNGGFTTGGTGWYRKTFTIPEKLSDKQFIIMFEGVYMNAEVWLNGEFLGNHPYGYTSFWFNVTDKIKFEKENVLTVKVKNEGENSRWYSGSGIYRHVWLNIFSPVHIAPWGTYITTPQVTDKEALINIKTSVANPTQKISKITLVTKVFDAKGQEQIKVETDKTIDPGKTIEIVQEMKLNKPTLWSTDSPILYKTISEIHESESVTDQVETEFGIRTISFDAINGFMLNGKTLKLRGGCVHHDNGILGSKAYDRAEERRVELLKSSGFNAIRSSHNPPSPAFLNACDRLGIIVIDEAFDMWKEEKNPYDYHLYFIDWWKKDIESMILRDRNHPSVIFWSIGNEIPNRQKPEVVEMAKTLASYVRLIDPTRPVTSAVNDLRPDKDPYFATLDVAGYNYASGGDHNQKNLYEMDHGRLPKRVMVGTESYPLEAFGSWMDVVDHPYVIGDFVWTAFDYIGEASIGWRGYFQKQDFFPWNLAYCGDLDICGWKRAQSYYRDALWNVNKVSIWITPPQPSFSINPERQPWSKWHWNDVVDDWNWKGNEEKIMEVNIYSSCGQVELFLNGKPLGKKITDRSTKYMAEWQVPYEPGIIKAVGFEGKKQVAVAELHSTGEATQIKLSADRNKIRSDGQDLSYITVELTDNEGVRNPKAENQVSFELDGPGIIAGVGNANPVSLESFQLPQRKA
ncbi:MAG: glycoside hydrolase family 2 TIM barrel-domain containing protein, partial [Bacteroidales bacterium]